MKLKNWIFAAFAAATLAFAGVGTATAATVQSFDFTGAVTTGPTQAANTWYVDRYAPAGFATSGGELVQTISAADSASNRPAAYNSSFYDTQGRKYDLNPGVTGLSIDLFVPLSWATTGQRMAGLWGTAFDASDVLTSYPIIEFASDGAGARFQGWNDLAGWESYALPVGFQYDTFHTIGFELNGSSWEYVLDGNVLGQVSALGSTYLGNVILQGYNKFSAQQTAGSYDIRWDNLVASNGVPEPDTLALALGALGIGGFATRRKTVKGISPVVTA